MLASLFEYKNPPTHWLIDHKFYELKHGVRLNLEQSKSTTRDVFDHFHRVCNHDSFNTYFFKFDIHFQ